ncbi:sensor histidine kinase [Pantanalinema sp. GBBB05]|uniref:sensor histidine kinase n=1 Tax=Pantanalinema sp. GBBB05 TaxID=2604139 RepID=UPI003D813C77
MHISEYSENLLKFAHLFQQHYPQPVSALQEQMDEMDVEFLLEDMPKLVGSMKLGVERIRQIVLSLRNFSRLDEAEFKAVDIHEGIDSTLLILHNRLKARPDHPEIQIIKEYGELPLIECYAGQLNQVFMNLLSNAIDALESYDSQRSPEAARAKPSQIVIHTEITEEQLVSIKIRDNGAGIPEAVRNRLFDPFFTTKPIGKGTGLGLSISHQIITEKHHGEIGCVSELGHGAEFWIKLPIQQAST